MPADQCKWKLIVQLCIFVIVRTGNNSLVHELRAIIAVKLHLNAPYAQHPALKLVDEKNQ